MYLYYDYIIYVDILNFRGSTDCTANFFHAIGTIKNFCIALTLMTPNRSIQRRIKTYYLCCDGINVSNCMYLQRANQEHKSFVCYYYVLEIDRQAVILKSALLVTELSNQNEVQSIPFSYLSL
jgi:hypothetical protein